MSKSASLSQLIDIDISSENDGDQIYETGETETESDTSDDEGKIETDNQAIIDREKIIKLRAKEEKKKIKNMQADVLECIKKKVKVESLSNPQLKKEAELFHLIKKRKKTASFRKNNRAAIKMLHDCLDSEIIFLVDCTGSMDHSIVQVMNNVTGIIDFFEKSFNEMKLQVGFVGYRDVGDYVPLDYFPFQKPEELAEAIRKEYFEEKTVIENNEEKKVIVCTGAYGGNDVPEDIHQALYHIVHEVKWSKPTRILIHITDSIAHGKIFEDERNPITGKDDYPNGMCYNPNLEKNNGISRKEWIEKEGNKAYPYSQTISELIQELRKNQVWYHFLEVPERTHGKIITKKMTSLFKRWYEEAESVDTMQLQFLVHGYEQEYLKNIRECIHRSLVCQAETTMAKYNGKYANKPFYKFRVDKDRKREWGEVRNLNCYILSNEREMCAYNVEHYEPRLRKQVRKFRIQKTPFDEGGVRFAFLIQDMEPKNPKSRKMYVAKCFKQKKEEVIKLLREDIRIQVCAKRLAEQFNKDLEAKTDVEERLRFISMDIMAAIEMDCELMDGSKELRTIFMTLEEFIEKNPDDPDGFVKFNNQLNATTQASLYSTHDVCQAFSHYTTYLTGGFLIVCDLQGFYREKEKLYILTDPAVHSFVGVDSSKKFETTTNFGVDGMKEFLKFHRCNEVCKKLNLNTWNLEEWVKKRNEEIKKLRNKLLDSGSDSDSDSNPNVGEDSSSEDDEDEDEDVVNMAMSFLPEKTRTRIAESIKIPVKQISSDSDADADADTEEDIKIEDEIVEDGGHISSNMLAGEIGISDDEGKNSSIDEIELEPKNGKKQKNKKKAHKAQGGKKKPWIFRCDIL